MRLEHKQSLAERLQEQPALRARVEQLLELVEGTELTILRADEAAEQVGAHLRQLGQETLQAWADTLQARQRSVTGTRGRG